MLGWPCSDSVQLTSRTYRHADWTSFDVSGQWFAKSAGTVMFFTLMSPFFAGVSYETFVRMTLPAHIFNLGLFIQGGLFLSTTGPDGCSNSIAPINLWIPQIGMGVAFTIWNLLAYKEEATGGPIVQASKDGATYFCWAMAIVYAATFGVRESGDGIPDIAE